MKKLLYTCSLLLMCLPVLAEPGWTEVQAVVRAQFHKYMDHAGAITEIAMRDEGSTWLNRDIFPERYEFAQGVWVSYEGDLPGEIRRQVMSAYFFREIILDNWVFDGLGIPVSGVTRDPVALDKVKCLGQGFMDVSDPNDLHRICSLVALPRCAPAHTCQTRRASAQYRAFLVEATPQATDHSEG